jgi:Kef-type K+ transport system membrane component KefB
MVGSLELSLLILLLVVLAGPIIAERFKIPGLIGLIFFGMFVGPFMLGWLGPVGITAALGDIGLLYLMFLAGLSFNIRAFMENRTNAIVYGLLGFFVPFGISFYFGISFIELSVLGAALIGAMWASNTLVAYPEVLAAGLQNNRAVSAAVSAGVVADLLSLTVLAIVTSTAVIDIEAEPSVQATTQDPALPLWIGLPLLIVVTLWALPKVADWFFVRVGHTRMQRFVFALAGMSAGAAVALLAGVEGLIGAFLAGLGLNLIIPARSALMDRIEFVGGAIFVPAFLVSIGLAIDPRALFDVDTVILALAFTLLVLIGKGIAAGINALIFKLSLMEFGLMTSLSVGQAASTLAIAQVGVALGLFGREVVNASILAVVTTAFITSYGTRFFVQRVDRPAVTEVPLGENVLVDVRDQASDLKALMAVAGDIARTDRGVVTPYLVPTTGQLEMAKLRVERANEAAAVAGHDSSGEIRVDDDFVEGTLFLAEEVGASLTIVGWHGLKFPADLMFDDEVDPIGERSTIPTVAARVLRDWDRVLVFTGDTANEWHREDAMLAVTIGHSLAARKGISMVIATRDTDSFAPLTDDASFIEVRETSRWRAAALGRVTPTDIIVVPPHAIRESKVLGQWRVAKALEDTSIIVVGGPHRLSVGGNVVQTNLHSVVDATDASTARVIHRSS